jgi:two-component system, cell cycle sensor histidine kinase and response regulator CckA
MSTSPSCVDKSGRTILVADDTPAVLALVVEFLHGTGYNVLQAVDGVEALEVAAQHSGVIDLLLTDIEMPRLDGHGLSRRLSRRRPETRTLFMSGRLDTGLVQGTPLLAKPFVGEDLLRKVSEVLDSRAAALPA